MLPLSTRQWTLSALMSTALLTVPTLPVVAQETKKEPVKPVETVKLEDFNALKTQVSSLKGSFEELQKSVRGIREMIEGTDKQGSEDGLQRSLKRIELQLTQLETKLKDIEKKQAAMVNSTSEKNPITPSANPGTIPTPMPAPPVTTATIRLVNEYPIEVSILINGTAHRIDPNSSKDVSVAAGAFKYQLLTSGLSEVSSPVKAGEVLTLRIK
ncbi:MAG: hypothetical protein ACRCZF_07695 [Gemmataceae bacterium]